MSLPSRPLTQVCTRTVNSYSSSSLEVVSPHSTVRRRKRWRKRLSMGVGFVASLAVFDIAVNILFPYPTDIHTTSPGPINLRFDYGRSTVAKVFRKVGNTDQTTAPLAKAGWLKDETLYSQAVAQPEHPDDLFIALYGMSFTWNVAEQLKQLSPNLSVRAVGGPASPPNHSFAAYQLDQSVVRDVDVAVFGILASSVQGTTSMSNMTWAPEVPAPYTYPRYKLIAGELQPIWPVVQSLDDLRQAKEHPHQWSQFEKQLETYDSFYNAIGFSKLTFLDHSALARLLRRNLAQKQQQKALEDIYNPQIGFNPDWEGSAVLRQKVQEFAAQAHQQKQLPLILLIHDQGYSDHLFQLLHPILVSSNIPYVSTHEIALPDNADNFLADGHFTASIDAQLSKTILQRIQTYCQDHASHPAISELNLCRTKDDNNVLALGRKTT